MGCARYARAPGRSANARRHSEGMEDPKPPRAAKPKCKLGTQDVLSIAVATETDPRTVLAVLLGGPVINRARLRVWRHLEEKQYLHLIGPRGA
jgi:hypothetical protein